MAQAQAAHDPNAYFVPHHSRWPLFASVALFVAMYGLASWFNETSYGRTMFFVGIAGLIVILFKWFADVILESVSGYYNKQVDGSFRMGMVWFIFSEVMFFSAFFGALFYTRWLIVPWLGGAGSNAMTHELLWPNFQAMWPLTVTPAGDTTQAMGAWGLPAINTAILLVSSITLTIAHHALLEGKRGTLIAFQAATVVLGIIFLFLQVEEYIHAYTELGLTLDAGIYGSLFFLLTGFHGAHVTIGTIFLFVTLVRVIKGHFDEENNFAWEAGAWYWHFVDVVWLFLFITVYWL